MMTPLVRIRKTGCFAIVEPPMPDLLRAALSYPQNEFRPGGYLGFTRRTSQVPYFQFFDGEMHIPEGLVSIAADCLRRHGQRVEIVEDGRRFAPGYEQDTSLRDRTSGPDRDFLEILMTAGRGTIEVPNLDRRARMIALVCQLYPRARILVAVARHADASLLLSKMPQSVSRRAKTNDTWDFPDRGCLLLTMRKVDLCLSEDWDILILPNAVEALAPSHRCNVYRLARKIVFGFVDSLAGLDQRTRLLVLATCGTSIYPMEQEEPTEVPVRVAWCRGTSGSVASGSPLGRKRSAVWQNDSRNDLIASLANAVTRKDLATLNTLTMPPSGLEHQFPENARVCILVETVEHGRALLRRLPGWALIDAVAPVQRVGFAGCHQRIITTMGLRRLTSLDVNVVIRADGTPWPICAKVFPPRPRDGKVLLVDFADRIGNVIDKKVKSRAAGYLQRDWIVENPEWINT